MALPATALRIGRGLETPTAVVHERARGVKVLEHGGLLLGLVAHADWRVRMINARGSPGVRRASAAALDTAGGLNSGAGPVAGGEDRDAGVHDAGDLVQHAVPPLLLGRLVEAS
jgi:hypothetical protein